MRMTRKYWLRTDWETKEKIKFILGRWPNIKPTLSQCLVLAGSAIISESALLHAVLWGWCRSYTSQYLYRLEVENTRICDMIITYITRAPFYPAEKIRDIIDSVWPWPATYENIEPRSFSSYVSFFNMYREDTSTLNHSLNHNDPHMQMS